METAYFEHPTEEALERFLLSRSSEEETDIVETHFLACPSCVTRLESLEDEIAVLRSSLIAFEKERKEKQAARAARISAFRNWLTIPKLSLAGAGAFAALAVGTFVIPQYTSQDVMLLPNRGPEVQVAPEHRALHLHLNAPRVSDGPVSIAVLGTDGTVLYNTTSVVRQNSVSVHIPELKEPGTHFVRLYRPGNSTPAGFLHEYSLDVK